MDLRTSLLLAVFQLLDFTMAEWDPFSPLVLVDIQHKKEDFSSVVTMYSKFQCKLYYIKARDTRTTTHYYCPVRDAENIYCNYAESFVQGDYESGKRPDEKCPSAVRYDIIPVKNSSTQNETCNYFGNKGQFYEFVYWRCKYDSDEKETTSINKICFHHETNRIIFGTYTIRSPILLTNMALDDEQNYPFDFDFWPSLDKNMNPFQRISHKLYSQNREYLPRSVLPHEWLPYGHQRGPLFHYMNVAPMLKVLKVGWEILMRNLRNRIAIIDRVLHVTAGLIDKKEGEPSYGEFLGSINNTSFIAIPYIWWILIYTLTYSHGIVIMMHNQPLEIIKGNQNMSYYDENLCSHDVCKEANLHESFPDVFPLNFMYCCQPSVIVNRLPLYGQDRLLRFPYEPVHRLDQRNMAKRKRERQTLDEDDV